MYAAGAARYLAAFSASNVLAVDAAELARDPHAVMTRVQHFLGLPHEFMVPVDFSRFTFEDEKALLCVGAGADVCVDTKEKKAAELRAEAPLELYLQLKDLYAKWNDKLVQVLPNMNYLMIG